MPDLRNLGGLTDSQLDAHEQDLWFFIRLDFPSGPGILRMVNRPGGYVGNVDGTSQTWTFEAIVVGNLQQGRDSPLDVSWIEFAHDLPGDDGSAGIWTQRAQSPGFLGVPVTIWRAHFDPVTPGMLAAAWIAFAGTCDEARGSTRMRVSLVPYGSLLNKPFPARRFLKTCQNRFKDANCQFAGPNPFCGTDASGVQIWPPKTREACAYHSNLPHFVGFDLMPPPGFELEWQGVKVSLPSYPGAPVAGYVPTGWWMDPVTGRVIQQWGPG